MLPYLTFIYNTFIFLLGSPSRAARRLLLIPFAA
jgi:hypothetical protein